MKVYVTGAEGFIGKNLVARLKTLNQPFAETLEEADFIFHLAGSNRPTDVKEFYEVNAGFTAEVVQKAKAPILFTSTAQVGNGTDYAKSKEQAEELLGEKDFIYRLPGVFGKWSKPNYNTVIATFCHNVAHNLPIQVNDPATPLTLVYIDDVVNAFIKNMETGKKQEIISHTNNLGFIAQTIQDFRQIKTTNIIPQIKNDFVVKLYATYLSFLPTTDFGYPLTMHKDDRGSFTEFLKIADGGQVSVNVIKPNIEKGHHWHDTKNEKFLVISGEATVRFRKYNTAEILEYEVNGDKHTVIDIPTGYTHSIKNTGTTDCIFVIWASEWFDPQNADTYMETV